MKLFVVLVLVAIASASASPLHVPNPFDKTDYCALDYFEEDSTCAVLFDDNNCKGWAYPVGKGYTKLPYMKRDDAESAVVRKGCVLTGYDEAHASVQKRGLKVVLDATHAKKVHEFKGRKGLEERIESVSCDCVDKWTKRG